MDPVAKFQRSGLTLNQYAESLRLGLSVSKYKQQLKYAQSVGFSGVEEVRSISRKEINKAFKEWTKKVRFTKFTSAKDFKDYYLKTVSYHKYRDLTERYYNSLTSAEEDELKDVLSDIYRETGDVLSSSEYYRRVQAVRVALTTKDRSDIIREYIEKSEEVHGSIYDLVQR